ncbi:uncharacterized protein KY384_003203 [Bacidia gigantensis]|uniref:uncharacterized protein n=1 Tax=Bacidia gigantensis TaxID=2732470 RepID=UPI001D054AEE|nr:uncharacterized protein KY384_003203 [Bacidia gigantensis]KAG8531573.1 hypothetical protein KY384_003203 [Bacidia gigantensis]
MVYFANLCLLATLASAQSILESSSFGQTDRISPNGVDIPGWHISGEGQVPQLLSDKIVLTPPYPGNIRGAAWSGARVEQSDWMAELDFRASGPARGSGNLQVWFTKDGRAGIDTASLYTVGNFDGMVISIDQYGGKVRSQLPRGLLEYMLTGTKGGSIRGFMNDGSIDFKHHYSVDSLAFGHCDFSFRNLGRPSRLKIRQEPSNFEVVIDDKLCFSSDKIRMPSGYSFGLTAASAETPDSFEAYKFQLSSLSQSSQRQDPRQDSQSNAQQGSVPISQSYESQFGDLTNRLQSLAQAVQKLEDEIGILHRDSDAHYRDIERALLNRDTLNSIISQNDRIERIDKTLTSFQSQVSNLHGLMKDSHDSLTEGIPKHLSNIISTNAPRMGMLIFIFVVIQVLLYGVYTLYKRRSKQGPKKYL